MPESSPVPRRLRSLADSVPDPEVESRSDRTPSRRGPDARFAVRSRRPPILRPALRIVTIPSRALSPATARRKTNTGVADPDRSYPLHYPLHPDLPSQFRAPAEEPPRRKLRQLT